MFELIVFVNLVNRFLSLMVKYKCFVKRFLVILMFMDVIVKKVKVHGIFCNILMSGG